MDVESKKKILIKSREECTGIMYTFLISKGDGLHILENGGQKGIIIEDGCVNFKDDGIVEIKQGTGRAFLDASHVIRQLATI